mmetsp:Transcript_8294/g.23035  ORF Transcript_8294/g.23035 Transcript_8294/m.23035 type:complete len:143 (-) Transcript_8294:1404-1832(-)
MVTTWLLAAAHALAQQCQHRPPQQLQHQSNAAESALSRQGSQSEDTLASVHPARAIRGFRALQLATSEPARETAATPTSASHRCAPTLTASGTPGLYMACGVHGFVADGQTCRRHLFQLSKSFRGWKVAYDVSQFTCVEATV